MKNTILMVVALAFLSLGVTSCAAMSDFFGEGTVFTTEDQLQEGEAGVTIPWEDLPDGIKEQIPEGTVIVMADEDQLVPDAGFIPAGGAGEDGSGFMGVLRAGLAIGTAFVPGLAAYEGILLALSQRKRKHWGKALKAAAPIPGDWSIRVGDAAASVASAVGAAHSSETTAVAFAEEELEADFG